MTPENWNEQYEELASTRWLHHNQDQFEFLVKKVWKFDRPLKIVDFGCGFGYLGIKLLELLPDGCQYTGIDNAPVLLEQGRRLFSEKNWQAEFIEHDIHSVPLEDNSFDLATTHAVLMHIPDPDIVVDEMIRVTRSGGMLLSCEANRNLHTAGFHIHETNEQESTPLDFFQRMNTGIREKLGIDYNIGLKLPVTLHQKGLTDIQARFSDKINLHFPPMDNPEKERLIEGICTEGYGYGRLPEEEIKRRTDKLLSLGLDKEEIAIELEREMTRDIPSNGKNWHIVYPGCLSWVWGTV